MVAVYSDVVRKGLREVLLVTNDLGPRAGGIETFLLGLIQELDGTQIVIYTSSQPGDLAFDSDLHKKCGVLVIRDKSKILLPTPRVNRAVRKVMQEYQSSIIWFGATAPLAWMAGHLRRNGAKRIVGITHGHEVWWSTLFPFTLIMRTIVRKMDVLTYLGDFTRNAMRPAVGAKIGMVQIAPGIFIDHFSPGAKSPELVSRYRLANKLVIVCVGRLVHRKGQDQLIAGMPKILRVIPEATLLIIGEGPYKEKLEKLTSQLNLGDCVRFIGRLSYDSLPEHLRLGDLFVMPSRSRFFGLEVEGLGIVYLEASACGLPVIAGDSGGAPDAVIEGATGVVVDGTRVNQISEAVISLLLDPALRTAMGERGREWVVNEWNWGVRGEKFKSILFGY